MIEFRQKVFVVPLVGLAASTAAGIGISAVQTSKHHKQDAEQQEEFQRQQQAQQKKQNEALNRIAKAAEAGDMSKAQQAANIIQQRSYASIPLGTNGGKLLTKLLNPKTGGQTVYEFGRALNNAGGGNQIAKKIGSGLAMGVTMGAGSYVLDKAIQADRKRLTGGAPLPQPQEDPGKKKKAIKKAITSAALVGGSVLAARKGMLGEGFKNLTHKSTTPINLAEAKKLAGQEFKSGMTGKAALGGLGFAGIFTLPSYLGERKQLKDQARQKQYTEDYQYQLQANEQKKGSALKKLALGTVATIGTAATLRRVGPTGIRKGINEMYMTYGKKIAGQNGNKVGNWMMNSGAKEYGKAQAKATQKTLQSLVEKGKSAQTTLADPKKLDKLKDKYKKAPKDFDIALKNMQKDANLVQKRQSVLNKLDMSKLAESSGKSKLAAIQKNSKAGRKVGEGLLGGISKMWLGAGRQETAGFLNKLAKNGNVSQTTRDTANWLSNHKRTALVGAIGVGSIAFKPFTWGEKAVRGAAKSVDKNAFAYEKSKEQQVQ